MKRKIETLERDITLEQYESILQDAISKSRSKQLKEDSQNKLGKKRRYGLTNNWIKNKYYKDV